MNNKKSLPKDQQTVVDAMRQLTEAYGDIVTGKAPSTAFLEILDQVVKYEYRAEHVIIGNEYLEKIEIGYRYAYQDKGVDRGNSWKTETNVDKFIDNLSKETNSVINYVKTESVKTENLRKWVELPCNYNYQADKLKEIFIKVENKKIKGE